jgi:uncharacterized protein YndB with AHSA1/START domain
MPEHGTESVVVAATPAQVWAVLADPTRTGEWSHEAAEVRWAPGSSSMVVGARFIGTSRVGRIRWTRTCEVLEVRPQERLVWKTLLTWKWRENTEWRYELTEVEGGTQIEQSYRILRLTRLGRTVLPILVPSHRDRSEALRDDLVRLGRVAAATPQAPPTVTSPS